MATSSWRRLGIPRISYALSINNVRDAVLIGAGLAVFVLLFFLRSISSTLIIGVAIPISVIATFALMYFNGFTLNTVSFGGLALGRWACSSTTPS